MKKKLSMGKILIMQRGASLVAVLAMLVISIAAAISLSFGWFAKNNQVTASGMHTQAYKATFSASYAVKVAENASYVDTPISDLFSGLVAPGDSVNIRVTVTNTGKYAVNLTQFGFEAPTQRDDVPKYDEEGNPRYLSTELYAELLSIYKLDPDAPEIYEATIETLRTKHYLRERNAFSAGAANQIDFMSDMEEGTLIPLAAGETVTFEISVTFEKTDYDQNVYKGFADHGGKCVRRFFLTYDN